MTWIDITAPVVGGKITAAGFGLQVDIAVAQLQGAVDTFGPVSMLDVNGVREWATAGRDVPGLTLSGPSAVTVAAGITTVVAAPSSGTRVVKGLFLHAPTAGTTVTLTLGSTVLAVLPFTSAGLAELDCAIPLVASDTNGLRVTATGGTIQATATYADRADALVARFGLANGSSSGTLIASSGSARTITELWIGNASASTAGAATIQIGAGKLIDAFAVPSQGLVLVDMPIPLPASTAVTWTGDGVNALTFMASGH